MPAILRDLLASCAAVLLRAAGIVAAFAPSRWWRDLDEHVPVTSSAILSGILTIVAAAALGIPGFLAYAQALSDRNVAVFLEAAVKPEAVGVLDSSALAGMTGLALFTFLFLTPAGLATVYLGATGFLRTIAAWFDDDVGDPILTAIDAAVSLAFRRTQKRVRRSRRESLQGPEMPDRVVRGAALGLADAELVIVSSRAKEGWDRGTVVIACETCYRVGTIEERTIAGRLRTLYPLTEHRDLEAFRRAVHYEMPAAGFPDR